jgi:hypothetical protein
VNNWICRVSLFFITCYSQLKLNEFIVYTIYRLYRKYKLHTCWLYFWLGGWWAFFNWFSLSDIFLNHDASEITFILKPIPLTYQPLAISQIIHVSLAPLNLWYFGMMYRELLKQCFLLFNFDNIVFVFSLLKQSPTSQFPRCHI